MNFDLSTTHTSRVGYQILAYLVAHPDAQDTLEGIVEWWMLERHIKYQADRIQAALSNLVSRGLILQKKGSDSQTRYRINQARYSKIQELISRKKL